MKTLLTACLFLTLLSPVSSEPSICWGTGIQGIDMFGYPVLCETNPEDSICYSNVIDFPVNGVNKNHTLHRELGCRGRQDCHPRSYTASFQNDGYLYMKSKCCDEILCNGPLSVPSQKNRSTNGMQCPSCFTTSTGEPCTSNTTVNCHGKENRCIAYTGILKPPVFTYPILSFKGCATKDLCELLTGAVEEGTDLLDPIRIVQVKCSAAEYTD